ncbi:MAG: shikimate dehydrogenase [Chitinophagaceae bacterium]
MRQFGLIGYPLSHSFSKKFFAEKFAAEKLDNCAYDNYPIAEIGDITSLVKGTPFLEGLNVTIPYKEQVIPFLSDQSAVVKETGACNCIKIEDGKLYGHNTDVTGFELSLITHLAPHHSQALILGTGGAAKAVEYVLRKLGIHYRYVSRNPTPGNLSYAAVTPGIMTDYTLIINTTPLGMYPDTDSLPLLPYESLSTRHYLFDLVYNPATTRFLSKGEQQGAVIKNGAGMLLIQAEESWKIWNGLTA